MKDAVNQGSKVIAQHLQMIQQLAKDQNVNLASNADTERQEIRVARAYTRQDDTIGAVRK